MRKKTLQELMKERANQSTDTSAYTEKEMPKSTQQRYIMPQEQSTWNKIQERANQILNNTFSTFSNNQNFTRFNYERQQHEDRLSGKYINNIQNNFLPTREGLKQQNQYFGKGNIDLNNRKIAKNEDGSISTVRSMSFYDDKEKKEILVPTVINGKVVSDDEAIDHYYNTGEYLGKFDTVKEANQYAENLHNEQEKQYSIKNNAILAKADEMNELYKKNIVNRVSNKVSDTLQKTLQTPENLKNGYQFGDLSTTAMSTLLGGTAHAIEGVKSVGDAIANHGAYAVASVADITGNHDFSERLINAIQLNKEDTENITQKINNIFDKSSVLGETGNKALESYGQSKVFGILGQKSEALKEAGKIGQSKAMKAFADSLVYTMGANAGFDEAYNQANTTGWEAILKATGGGLSSYISENINDVFGYGGNKVTKNVKEKFENVFKSGMAKAFAKLGFSSISEGAEEIVEDFLNTKVVNNIVNKVIEEKKYNTEINLEDSIENAVIAMVSVWAGGTPTTIQEGRQIQRNQEIINNSNLTDEQKTNLTQFAEEKNLNNEQIQKAIEMTENQATTMQNKAILNQEQQTIQQEGKQIQNQMSQETDNIEQKVLNLRQSIDNFNNSRTEGQEIFDINNEETRKEIESIQKIVEDRNINIRFDENRFKDNSQNAFYEYDENGNVANIILNPNATTKKYVENLAIHELVHSFSGDKKANLMKDVLNYAKTLEGYDKAYQDIKSNYEKVYGKNVSEDVINEEAVANILGEKLGNKEFVNDLVNGKYSTQNRNFVQKIYDFVKNQINRFKGYKNQEQYWTHIKELFDDAYRNSEVSQEGIKASVERNKLTNTRDSQGRQLSEGQVEYFKDSKVRDSEGNLKTMYHGTEANVGIPQEYWFSIFDEGRQGNNGSWFGNGFYFTENEEHAKEYAHSKGNVYEVYLDVKKPYIPYQNGNSMLSFQEDFKNNFEEARDIDGKLTGQQITDILKKNGYDGIIIGDNTVVFNSNQIKNTDNLNPTTNDDIRYSVETEDLKTDNQGNKLTKGQQEFFKGISKEELVDGKIPLVYHTMTDMGRQFNSFNPVGTPYYRFGEQVVNYYTDNLDMSGSYAGGEYLDADTTRYTSVEQVKDRLNNINLIKGTKFKLEKRNGIYGIYNENEAELYNKAKEFYQNLDEEEKEIIKRLDQVNFSDLSYRDEWGDSDKYRSLQTKYINWVNDMNEIYPHENSFGGVQNTNTPQSYLSKGLREFKEFSGDGTSPRFTYETEDELFRNVIQDIMGKNNYQYEGYVKLTNPYVVDARGDSWRNVEFNIPEEYQRAIDRISNIEYKELTKDLEDAVKKAEDEEQRISSEYTRYANAYNKFMQKSGFYTQDLMKGLEEIYSDWLVAFSKGDIENLDTLELSPGKATQILLAINPADANRSSADLQVYNEKYRPQLLDLANKIVDFEIGYDIKKLKVADFIMNMNEAQINNRQIYRNPNIYFEKALKEKLLDGYSDDMVAELGKGLKDIYPNMRFAERTNTVWSSDDIKEGIIVSLQDSIRRNTDSNAELGWFTTNDVVKKVLEMNKNGANYDGVIMKNVVDYGQDIGKREPGNLYVTFASNQFKAQDNETPTNDPDIRYSKDTTGEWNNFIEKYFKNEGTGTAIKDMKKLPEMSITKYQEVLNNAKYIPQEEKTNLLQEVQNIKRNKSSLDEFKNLVNDMNNVYKEENTLNTKETYLTGRKEKYQKYLNSKTEYDNSALKNAMEIIPANNQGRRTKEQWLNVAKQIGTEIANKSNQEIEEIAFRSWQDERPSSKESLNRQGNKFVGFNSDEWINAIYDSVNEQRQYSVDTEQQAENQAEQQENVEQQTQQPVEQTVKEEKIRKKILNPTEISNLKSEDAKTTPELKDKKYKKGTKESNFAENIENDVGFLTEEQKKEILKDDNVKYYAPVTNADTLAKAYQDLKENGQNATLEWYSKDGKTSSAEDVAKGWILLKQYADKGDTQGMVNVAKKLRDMGTKAGQTVQAFNILSRLTPEGMVAYTQGELQDAYNEMIKGKSKKWIDEHKSDFDLSQEEVAFIMDTMQNLPAENPDTNNYERKVALGQIQKLFTDKIPVEGGKIKAWMRISMLFNPKTQVRNVAGNVGIVPVNAVADFLGSKVDKAVAKKTGVRTLGNPNVKSYLKGAKQGLYQSYNDFRLGINTRGLEGSKFEFGEGKSFKDKGIGKALNRTENILNFVMDAGDRAFSQGSFTNSLNNQMVLNGVDTPTQEMIDIAMQEALSRTWNDNNEYTNFVLGIRKGLNKIGTKNYGLGDVLIPFAKTPANLTKAIVDYSPVGLVNAIKEGNNLKNAIETGQFTPMQQHKFVDSLGKALAGTMLYVIGYGLAKAGIATGEADEDKDVKNFMKNSLGIGSYSIKIGNKSFAYDWAQPVATPIAIMTNLYQTNKNNSDATILEKALNAVNIGTNQIMEQSFMDSLNEVLNGNGEITERLQKAVLDLPARAIPTFSKQIADLVDSTQRTSFEYGKPLQSSINAVKAKIPFASKTLTPVVDTLGNEVKRYGGENNVFNVFLNPANMNKGQLSKAGKEIYNVYMQTGDTTVFPVTAPYYVNYKGDKLTMTAQERADYQRISGKYTEEVMNKLLNNSNYKSLSDEDKAEIISKVVNDSNSKAKKDVLDIPNKDIDKIEKIGSNYYDYKLDTKKALDKKRQETGKTTTQLTDNEKISVLKNKNYSKKEKDLLYINEIGDDDTVYTSMKLLNGNSLSFIDSYFDYKMGSKKSDDLKQFLNNNNQLTYMQKLYLTGVNNSSLNSTERQKLKNYIYSLNITEQQRKTMENKLKFTTEMKDGSYKWK